LEKKKKGFESSFCHQYCSFSGFLLGFLGEIGKWYDKGRMWNDSQLLFLVVILPFFFAVSLVLEGVVKRRSGEGGKVELVLGNVFLVLILMAVILMTIR